MSQCADCKTFVCHQSRKDLAPDNCPMRLTDLTDTREVYADPKTREVAQVSAIVEAAGYCRWTRVEETMQFARRLGIKRLGLAFCVGLKREAKTLTKVLESNGFEVVSVVCKTGSIPKEEIGLKDEDKVRPGTVESMCNPIAQARLMNASQTGLNIILGLCVGHDSLFIKHSDALVTCLVAKDRVLAHNPIGAIYCAESYYKSALVPDEKSEL
jgi:uncharacterized metal-binding protein